MRVEEIPDVDARVEVPAFLAVAGPQRLIAAGPVMSAAFDRIERDIRTVLAVFITLDARARAVIGIDIR